MTRLVKTEWNRPAAWIGVLLLTLLSGLAEADVEAGITAYQGGDFVTALRAFQGAGKHDDVRALNYLGVMYAEGLGTLRDDHQAKDMFYKAAILGYPEAMANLARMYAEGRGGQQDNKAAVSAYWAAAKAGFKPAIIRMTEIYENGELGEAPDEALAREWRARSQGQPTQIGDSSRRKILVPVPNVLKAVAVTKRRGQILIRVRMSAPLGRPLTGFVLAAPPRIALDFPNTVSGVGKSVRNIGKGDLRSIKLVQGRERTRMVLTLRKAMRHAAKAHGTELLITLTSGRHPAKQPLALETKPAAAGSE